MLCSKCRIELIEKAAFCPSCGQPVGGTNPTLKISSSLPKAVSIITWFMMIFGVPAVCLGLWMISGPGQQAMQKFSPNISSLELTQGGFEMIIFAGGEFILAIFVRRLHFWAYWGSIGLFIVQLLQQFVPQPIGQVNYSPGIGILLPVIFLIVFGVNYKTFIQAAKQTKVDYFNSRNYPSG